MKAQGCAARPASAALVEVTAAACPVVEGRWWLVLLRRRSSAGRRAEAEGARRVSRYLTMDRCPQRTARWRGVFLCASRAAGSAKRWRERQGQGEGSVRNDGGGDAWVGGW